MTHRPNAISGEESSMKFSMATKSWQATCSGALGYSLTGDTREHALFFCHGAKGRNGKSTLLETVVTILGDYATVVDPSIFMASKQREHPAAIADLVGRRYVVTSEIEKGQTIAEALIKRLTGDKYVKTRFMGRNWFEFHVQFKIWMMANDRPQIGGLDEGIWSRMKILPFEVFFPEEKRIKGLGDILVRDEGPGILGWLVEGCRKWFELNGLAEPTVVTGANQEYRKEEDLIAQFLDQCTRSFLGEPHMVDVVKVRTTILYARYVAWCESNGESDVLTGRKFGVEMTRRGYPLRGTNGKPVETRNRAMSNRPSVLGRTWPLNQCMSGSAQSANFREFRIDFSSWKILSKIAKVALCALDGCNCLTAAFANASSPSCTPGAKGEWNERDVRRR